MAILRRREIKISPILPTPGITQIHMRIVLGKITLLILKIKPLKMDLTPLLIQLTIHPYCLQLKRRNLHFRSISRKINSRNKNKQMEKCLRTLQQINHNKQRLIQKMVPMCREGAVVGVVVIEISRRLKEKLNKGGGRNREKLNKGEKMLRKRKKGDRKKLRKKKKEDRKRLRRQPRKQKNKGKRKKERRSKLKSKPQEKQKDLKKKLKKLKEEKRELKRDKIGKIK